ncbi:hypothetical protein GCM10008066_23320 [Oxalicibacterium faecigallinarum]|uniref:Uncharacterized protein n=1 Tax=Oxalicibacterium faecigallinarum TaxID=573741 RepID=A0A8J3F3I4_9BURK|nr:hypothetical protein GCM10008066_23320 [Oxalicibacterium faecigallinarum]
MRIQDPFMLRRHARFTSRRVTTILSDTITVITTVMTTAIVDITTIMAVMADIESPSNTGPVVL